MLIELFKIGFAVRKRRRTVGMLIIKVRSEPVEYGHKVVTNAFHADFAAIYDILLISLDILVSRRKTEFYILVNGNTLDNLHFKPGVIREFFEFFKLLDTPDVTDRLIVNGGNNPRHSLNLFDVIKRYAIVFAIPPKRHLHIVFPYCKGVRPEFVYSITIL